MLEQQHGCRAPGIGEQTLLLLPLLLPGLFERHRPQRFKKDCVAAGPAHQPFLALVSPELRRARGSMKLLIHGRNLEVTPAIREYTETKLTRAINHFEGLVKEADVHLSVARNPRVPQQTAEVTMFANGTVIRAQERSDNLYASIDLVASKLTRQLNRFRERLHERNHGPVHRSARDEETGAATLPPPGGTLTDGKEAATPSRGVRRKYFAMAPMSVEDALQQLDVIDHDFFVFRDSDSGQIQVAYRRNHGGYGVIQSKD
jgi:putative sigma-54 modulation protein